MKQRLSGGIATAMNVSRGGAASSLRPGEGVTDTGELTRLIALLHQTETNATQRQRDILVGEFMVSGARVPLSFVAALQSLTRSEAAVLRLLGWGRSNPDIASLLDVNDNTVRTHMGNAVAKLNVDGARELISLAGLLFHPLD
jgi:DNA-binding CsgD family transcriptional regulator